MTGALIDLGPRIGAPSSGSRSGAGSKSDDTPTDAFTDVIEGVISDAAAAARPREHGRAGAHSAGRDDSRRAGSDGNGFVIGGGIDAAADSGHGMARDGSDAAPGMGRHRVGTGPDRSDRTAEDGRGDDTAAEQLGVTIVWSAATHGLPPAPGKHRTPAAHAEPNQVASVQHTTDHAPHPMTSAGLPRATGDASLVPAPVALPVGAQGDHGTVPTTHVGPRPLRPGGETPVAAPIASHGAGNPSPGPGGGTAGAGSADRTASVTVPVAVPAAATPSSRGHSGAAPHSVAHSPAAPSTGPVPAAQGSGAPEGPRVVQEPTGGNARTTPGSGHTVGASPSAAAHARGARVAPPLAPTTGAAPATPTTGPVGSAGPGGLADQARAHRSGTGSAATDSATTTDATTTAAATTAGAATPVAAHLTGTTLAHTTPTAAPAPPPPAPSQPPSQPLSQPDLAGTLAQLRAATDGTYQMRVAVHPAELGGVNVTAIVHHGMLTVTLSPDQTAHHAISQALPQLRAHLADQGFVGVDVGLGSPPQGGNQAGQQGSRTHGGDHATLAGSGDAVDGVDRSTRNARRPSDPTSALDRLL
jgi:hypothetical protein